MIDIEWCERNKERVIERDVKCQRCGQITTTYVGHSWATACNSCRSNDVVPFGGLMLAKEGGETYPFMIGEAE